MLHRDDVWLQDLALVLALFSIFAVLRSFGGKLVTYPTTS